MSVDKLIEKEPSLEFVIPVLKWLKDPESVSMEELKGSRNAAYAALSDACAYIAYTHIAYTYIAADGNIISVEKCVSKYFNEISITRTEVEAELFKEEEMKYDKEFFNNTKIKIESEEHNKYVQGLSFKADCSWLSGGKSFKWNDADFLYFGSDGWISCTRGDGIAKFETHKYKEIFIPMTAKEVDNTIAKLHLEDINATFATDEVKMKRVIEDLPKSTNDVVQNPMHYDLFEDTQVIEIIASSMSTEAFHGYCLGNVLKYRLRAGNKDDTTQEIRKADKYKELYKDFKHLCK